ncbi:DUF397 domain-containing protein [Streptomyces sp. ME19-01-6]|uniref:DUF397 domain-containing protein n=1 Tax=Streptomyces sp. ME19-01-6 TaxID=3028686 RepID=UPI0029AF1DFE|nr:DUF397 domain-containing protein [Streptomyces sp. ME19-01-6]MDX3226498.1 DUF397 domain-containing protein [Streptomyces sp. ME19-01-6]
MTLKPFEWIKSSYSTDDGPDCVEVAWAKSSYSTPDGPACVEVATTPDTIHIRDSKTAPQGPSLAFTPDAWTRFVAYASER